MEEKRSNKTNKLLYVVIALLVCIIIGLGVLIIYFAFDKDKEENEKNDQDYNELLDNPINSVLDYEESSKKQEYIIDVKNYLKMVKMKTISSDEYKLPTNYNEAVIITFESLNDDFEMDELISSYGGKFDEKKSFVMIVNIGSYSDPDYRYYIAAIDSKGYGIGEFGKTAIIEEKNLDEKNIIKINDDGINPSSITEFDVVKIY